MCLVATYSVQQDVKWLLRETGEMTAYKVLVLSDDGQNLVSPYKRIPYYSGTNTSCRKGTSLTEAETSSLEISEGIHVFVSRYDATRVAESIRGVVVPVKCLEKDFVAGGMWFYATKMDGWAECSRADSAVFTKVIIENFDYGMALKALQFSPLYFGKKDELCA